MSARLRDFDAHNELARRADAARRCGCHDANDQLDTAEGVINGVIIGIPLGVAMLGLLLLFVDWLNTPGLPWK